MTNETERSRYLPQGDGRRVLLEVRDVCTDEAPEDLRLRQLRHQRPDIIVEAYQAILDDPHGAGGRDELGQRRDPGDGVCRELGRVGVRGESAGGSLVEDGFSQPNIVRSASPHALMETH